MKISATVSVRVNVIHGLTYISIFVSVLRVYYKTIYLFTFINVGTEICIEVAVIRRRYLH